VPTRYVLCGNAAARYSAAYTSAAELLSDFTTQMPPIWHLQTASASSGASSVLSLPSGPSPIDLIGLLCSIAYLALEPFLAGPAFPFGPGDLASW
jgi:hypothetical protein